MKTKLFFILAIVMVLSFPSCKKEEGKEISLTKEKLKIGVVHISDPFSENSGYSYAHQMGIIEMKNKMGLNDDQILYKVHIDDANSLHAESAMRDLIAKGVNIVIATSWGYMDPCEKLALEYPSIIFAHATGYKHNDTNFTNYFGRVYQARYLSGIVAGAQTKTNKIGFVAAWGTENSEVTGGINAFAMGVKKMNPKAKVYVKITHSWFDPMGETNAARALINAGCDVIAQHCDTSNPQTEAEKAGVWGIGYNTDMSIDAPDAVLTSVLFNWGTYYTALVQSVIDGTFTTTPWFGSLKDGIVGITQLNKKINWKPEILNMLKEEQQLIESGAFDVFSGVIETNDARSIGKDGVNFTDDEIRNGINWYYRIVEQL